MKDNYPDGQADNPDAPWNEKSREKIEWESLCHGDCGNCGRESTWLNEKDICEFCYDLDPDYYDDEPDETPREDYE